MCVYVTTVPIDQNLRAASSVTRGPFRKWRQFQVAVVVQILLFPSVSLHFQQKEKKYISTRLNSINMTEYFNSFLSRIKKKNGDLKYKYITISTVVLHWCQVFRFSLILRDEHGIRTFEKRVLRSTA